MRNDREILLVSLFTFITVMTWIFFELVKTTQTSTVPVISEQVLAPLPKSLDKEVFTTLEQKRVYEPRQSP